MKRFIVTMIVSLGLMGGTALALATPTMANTCLPHLPVKHLSGIQNLTASNTKVVVADGTIATVRGNNDCILAGNGEDLTIRGNNNYVSGGVGVIVELHGTNNFYLSGGASIIDGGGAKCKVQDSDIADGCK